MVKLVCFSLLLIIGNIGDRYSIFMSIIGSKDAVFILNILLISYIIFLIYKLKNYRYFYLVKKIEIAFINYYNFELTAKEKREEKVAEYTIAFLFEELRRYKILPYKIKSVLSIINKKSPFYFFTNANKLDDFELTSELYTLYLEFRSENINSLNSFTKANISLLNNHKELVNEMNKILHEDNNEFLHEDNNEFYEYEEEIDYPYLNNWKQNTNTSKEKMIVVGVGNSGSRVINYIVDSKIDNNLYLITANTDLRTLNESKAQLNIQLGKNTSKGLGSGMNPLVGFNSAMEDYKEIKSALKDAKIVFISTGLGGGTGSGATPVIAKIAKEMGAITVSFLTTPFGWEGKKRAEIAESIITKLESWNDYMIVIPNDVLLDLNGLDTTSAFEVWNYTILVIIQHIIINDKKYISIDKSLQEINFENVQKNIKYIELTKNDLLKLKYMN